MLWQIFYDDETVVSDLDMTWENAPLYGVLFVVEHNPDLTRNVHMGQDYYIMRNNTIISFNSYDLARHIELGINPRSCKFGRWTPDDVWTRVHDTVFPPA